MSVGSLRDPDVVRADPAAFVNERLLRFGHSLRIGRVPVAWGQGIRPPGGQLVSPPCCGLEGAATVGASRHRDATNAVADARFVCQLLPNLTTNGDARARAVD
jgi:hypothetical protein